MEFSKNLFFRLLLNDFCFEWITMQHACTVPNFKLLEIIENLRHDEVQQRPELKHVVLNWSACEEQFVGRWKSIELAKQNRASIFQTVTLVNDKQFWSQSLKDQPVEHWIIIGGYDYIVRSSFLIVEINNLYCSNC